MATIYGVAIEPLNLAVGFAIGVLITSIFVLTINKKSKPKMFLSVRGKLRDAYKDIFEASTKLKELDEMFGEIERHAER